MNPYVNMTTEQIQDHFASTIVATDDDVSHALSRLASIAREEGCAILAVLLDTLADEPPEIAAMRLPALRDLVAQAPLATIPAVIAVLESVDTDFAMPVVLKGAAA